VPLVAVIELEALRKEYRGRAAVDGLDLSVPEGGVFGFLGPNGAGKTTTIRCLLGLVRATSGRARVLGAEVPTALAIAAPRIGSIVEAPSLFPSFSGRRNLELLGRIDGIDGEKVATMLERVGLAGREDDLVRKYSLGMKQRLGLAAALLKDPELLVLDPAGIKEFRELIRSLGAEGRTVFVSSHLLGEVQLMCDRVAIIARGKLVTQGSVAEILAMGHPAVMVARVPDPARAVEVLNAAAIGAAVYDGTVRIALGADEAARATEALARAGMYLSELRPEEVDLETVFLELTGDAAP
jgi:ABC-2 type transport system ATP-binding protein